MAPIESAMPVYRAYVRSPARVEDATVFACQDDQQAIEDARKWAAGRAVELWEADRLVVRIATAEKE
jgi:hypothetical protein